jgi:hypothetical protein
MRMGREDAVPDLVLRMSGLNDSSNDLISILYGEGELALHRGYRELSTDAVAAIDLHFTALTYERNHSFEANRARFQWPNRLIANFDLARRHEPESAGTSP